MQAAPLRFLTGCAHDCKSEYSVGFGKGSRFVAVNAFRFENREEIFRHGVVIRIANSFAICSSFWSSVAMRGSFKITTKSK